MLLICQGKAICQQASLPFLKQVATTLHNYQSRPLFSALANLRFTPMDRGTADIACGSNRVSDYYFSLGEIRPTTS